MAEGGRRRGRGGQWRAKKPLAAWGYEGMGQRSGQTGMAREASAALVGVGVRFERIRRITGYLVGTLDRFNNAKRAEERDRVKHVAMQGWPGEQTEERHGTAEK